MDNKNRKNSNFFKYLCICTLISGFIYSIVLSFCWGNDPFDPLGTLSLLCEDRKIFFWIWIIVDGGGLFLNINYMYGKYGNAGKAVRLLPAAAILSAVLIALTLGHSIADWNPKRIAHWVATGAYIVFLAASVAVYAIVNIKKAKVFKGMLIGTVLIFALFGLWFIILGKSGMLEMIPRALLEIMLFILNFVYMKKASGQSAEGCTEKASADAVRQ